MRSLEYVCAATGERIGFEGPIYGETMPAMRGRAWSYDLGTRGLTGVSRQARELTITVKAHDGLEALDTLDRLADADMAAGEPGRLVADGEWTASAWITKSTPQSITPTMVETELTIVLADGVWTRRSTTHFNPRSDADSTGLDYPHNYPHDYSGMSVVQEVSNTTGMTQPVALTIFGPCVNPYVIIGRNRYEVDVSVPAGSRLEIDGTGVEKTVTMVSDMGLRANQFSKALRGSGRGSGTYVFEPLATGSSSVKWAGGFEFDLTVCEERSAPPWT